MARRTIHSFGRRASEAKVRGEHNRLKRQKQVARDAAEPQAAQPVPMTPKTDMIPKSVVDAIIDDLESRYPLDVFKPLMPTEHAALNRVLKSDNNLPCRDRISADMARLTIQNVRHYLERAMQIRREAP